jgi:uncharacterized membrane protein
MLGLFSRKSLLSTEDNKRVVEAIRSTEQLTSGEIRVYLESRNPLVSTIERAQEIFLQLNMQATRQRNGVLLYIAVKDHEVALIGDEGIHQLVGSEFWNTQVQQMIVFFKENHLADGIVKCVAEVGNVLIEKFPFDAQTDKNELPDEVVFGK